MQNFIENLRGKSETFRKGLAFATSFFVVLVIGAVWISVVFPSFGGVNSIVAENSKAKPGPFSTITRNLAQPFAAARLQWAFIGRSLSEIKYEAETALEVISPEERITELRDQNSAQKNDIPATN